MFDRFSPLPSPLPPCQNPSASFVTSPTEVDFNPEETSKQLTLSIIASAFLSQGASFTITITSVELISSGGEEET